MAAVPAGCSRGPWDWWEWQKRASDSSSRGSGDQPRVLPRPSSRVPLARTNFWLSLLGLLAKIKCARATVVTSDPRGLFGLSGFCWIREMPGQSESQSVPRAGLRNTLRFRWRSDVEPIMSREAFGQELVLTFLEFKLEDVLCLQLNNLERSFEVTFFKNADCQQALKGCREQTEVRPISLFEVTSLDRPNFRLITVHMYNPHVTDQAIVAFLERYAEVLTEARRMRDSIGFWNGRRQFQVLLRADTAGTDGFSHPPAFFTIGADRGFLFYSRQPAFCRRCRRHGHGEQECGGPAQCRFCGGRGHAAKDCPVPKTCHRCGAAGHLARDCREKTSTYAAAASGSGGKAPTEAAVPTKRRKVAKRKGETGPEASGSPPQKTGARVLEGPEAAAATEKGEQANEKKGEAVGPPERPMRRLKGRRAKVTKELLPGPVAEVVTTTPPPVEAVRPVPAARRGTARTAAVAVGLENGLSASAEAAALPTTLDLATPPGDWGDTPGPQERDGWGDFTVVTSGKETQRVMDKAKRAVEDMKLALANRFAVLAEQGQEPAIPAYEFGKGLDSGSPVFWEGELLPETLGTPTALGAPRDHGGV